MGKLTKEQKAEIIKLYSEGVSGQKLAIMFGVSQATIMYYISPNTKAKTYAREKNKYISLTPEQRHEKYMKKKDYLKNYMANRYKNDIEFRKKAIARQIEYNKKKSAKLSDIKLD